ncbi:MAG: hypothetical protein ACYDCL_18945 [Myxococcales bacterium]
MTAGLALFCLLATPPGAADPQAQLARGLDHYLHLQLSDAVVDLSAAADSLERSLPAGSAFEPFAKAISYLGASYVGLGDRASAEAAFLRLLRLRPDYQIDASVFPPEVVEAYGRAKVVAASLPREPAPAAGPPAEAAPPIVVAEVAPRGGAPAAAWVLGGIGVAALAGGAVSLGLGLSLASQDHPSGTGPAALHSITWAQAQTANTEGTVGVALLAAGGAAAVGALIWILLSPSGRPAEHASGPLSPLAWSF